MIREPAPAEVQAVAERLFTGDGARFGPFRLHASTTVIPDALYRFEATGIDGQETSLSVFIRVEEELAGNLWEQEVRVLLRVSRMQHRALPTIDSGGYDEEHKLAWIAVPRVGQPADDSLYQHFNSSNEHKAAAVRHLGILADALSVLHGQGILHRNLWPGSLAATVEYEEDTPKLTGITIAGFETSTMLRNLLRPQAVDPHARAEELRDRFLAQAERPVDSLRYLPPERVGPLLGTRPELMRETDRGDVYSLGAIAWEWFLGRMPVEEHVDPEASGTELRDQLQALRREMRRRLNDPSIPRILADLLLEMLREDPHVRATSAQVAERVMGRYDAFVSPFEGGSNSRMLVMFQPKNMKPLYQYHWAFGDRSRPEGIEELKILIEEDLRGAMLAHEPRGAVPYLDRSGGNAKDILVGERAIWFCYRYRPLLPATLMEPRRFGEALDDVLLIRNVGFLKHSPKLRELRANVIGDGLHRRVSSVIALPEISGAALEDRRRGAPSWRPLIESVARPVTDDGEYTDAFDFLLELQDAELKLREYPYVRMSDSYDTSVTLELDKQRASENRNSDLFALLVEGRPDFGDFFDSDDAYGSEVDVEVRADRNGRPDRDGTTSKHVRRLDANTIEIRRGPKDPVVPQYGWIRPTIDRAAFESLRRQRVALAELKDQRGLLAQMKRPHGIKTARRRWETAGADRS